MNHDTPRSLARMHRLLRFCVLLLTFAVSSPMTVAETNHASNISLKLITEGIGAPIALAAIPDGSGRLLLGEQSGIVHLLDQNGTASEQLFLDVRPKMVAINKGMEERGLLGLALHPQFKSNRKFYAVYSAPRRTNAPPQWDHTQRLSEFKALGSNLTSAELASDGFLYLSVGDGGAHNDVGDVPRGRGHLPEGNGQRLDTLLGKVLRLDVDHGTPYGIPKDNPYADGKKGLPEIYAYGLRNPWGMSFDRGGKHDLILADVGQDRWEEINVIVNGGNYGWRLREGFDGFDPNAPRSAPTNAVTAGADGKPFVNPVLTYKTLRGRGTDADSFGVTVTGGYVYRGRAMPALVGKYIFADWSRSMGIPDGTLLVATIPSGNAAGTRWTVEPLAVKEFPNGRIKSFIWALGEDAEGELYILANGLNSAFGTRGKVFKLVPQ
jgi:hypothetical protein